MILYLGLLMSFCTNNFFKTMRYEFKMSMMEKINFFFELKVNKGAKELHLIIQIFERPPQEIWPKKYNNISNAYNIKLDKDESDEEVDEKIRTI